MPPPRARISPDATSRGVVRAVLALVMPIGDLPEGANRPLCIPAMGTGGSWTDAEPGWAPVLSTLVGPTAAAAFVGEPFSGDNAARTAPPLAQALLARRRIVYAQLKHQQTLRSLRLRC